MTEDSNTFEGVLSARLSRRDALKFGAGAAAAAAAGVTVLRAGAAAAQSAPGATADAAADAAATNLVVPNGYSPRVGTISRQAMAKSVPSQITFRPIPPTPATYDGEVVASGYRSEVVVRWGDPIFEGSEEFDPLNQTSTSQAGQFGYNCDFTGLIPCRKGKKETDAYLLVVNHEYTTGNSMFPKYPSSAAGLAAVSASQLKDWVDVELEAHGLSVVRIAKQANKRWTYSKTHWQNRRISANTPMIFSGPAAGDARVGEEAIGTLNNCSGGVTPWGTVLTAEENWNQYFANGAAVADAVTKDDHAKYGVNTGASPRLWEKVYPDRFDLAAAPNEAYKFGWIVEVDPSDPESTPVKHTALGRFKHEAAQVRIAKNGKVAVYSGDDERNQYVYKFVSSGKYNPKDREGNMALLSDGGLYVARFNADGYGVWKSLNYADNPSFWNGAGFKSQADICVNTRKAADLVGATKMDRPEDVDIHPKNGHVFIVCTNNSARKTDVTATEPGEERANPRFDASAGNKFGHIIELVEEYDDPSRLAFRWEIFLLAGDGIGGTRLADPDDAASYKDTYFSGWMGKVSPIACPDNIAFDKAGNMIIATDGQPGSINLNDGAFFVATEGYTRGQVKQLYAGPAGCEICGPTMTPDDKYLVLAIQHPGEEGTITDGDPANNPQSRWPDSNVYDEPAVPRPSVVLVYRNNLGRVGS